MGLELSAQMLSPLLKAGFVEASRPMRRGGILVTHEWKLVARKRVVNGPESEGRIPEAEIRKFTAAWKSKELEKGQKGLTRQ
jgi:hypothetical protein